MTIVQSADDTTAPLTPAYSDLVHYAAIGRALTLKAGYALDQRPPASLVLRALRTQGAAMSVKALPGQTYED